MLLATEITLLPSSPGGECAAQPWFPTRYTDSNGSSHTVLWVIACSALMGTPAAGHHGPWSGLVFTSLGTNWVIKTYIYVLMRGRKIYIYIYIYIRREEEASPTGKNYIKRLQNCSLRVTIANAQNNTLRSFLSPNDQVLKTVERLYCSE